jgi:hypothetical protein
MVGDSFAEFAQPTQSVPTIRTPLKAPQRILSPPHLPLSHALQDTRAHDADTPTACAIHPLAQETGMHNTRGLFTIHARSELRECLKLVDFCRLPCRMLSLVERSPYQSVSSQ